MIVIIDYYLYSYIYCCWLKLFAVRWCVHSLLLCIQLNIYRSFGVTVSFCSYETVSMSIVQTNIFLLCAAVTLHVWLYCACFFHCVDFLGTFGMFFSL